MKKLLLAAITAATITFTACKKEETSTPVQITADFTYTSANNYVPAVFTFNNTSTNASSYAWDFGDGTTSTQQNPTKTFTTAGNYTVKLVASANGSSSTTSKAITVLARPTKVILNSVTVNNTLLTKPSGGGWDLGSGPDVYFKLYTNGSEVVKSTNREDVTTNSFPLNWTATPPVEWGSMSSTSNIITFWDDDGLSKHEEMLSIILNTQNLPGLNYPKDIVYKQNGHDVVINVSYQ